MAEVARGHGGPPPKSLDLDENFKPKHTLFCPELRFVAIYALFLEILWHKKCLFSIKHDLARSCFKFWLKIGDEGDKISRKKLARH